MNILPPALIRMKDAAEEKGFEIAGGYDPYTSCPKEIARQVKKHG